MKPHTPDNWGKLDNAGKIFPSTANRQDTKVFRFSCELYEMIDPQILQEALDRTTDDFPIFKSAMRKGLFWYYLKPFDVRAMVSEESKMPCSAIYNPDKHTLLFNVTYYRKRINLEVYHALTDGTGAMQFLKTLVYHYVMLKYPQEFSDIDYDASYYEKAEDSFSRYYEKSSKKQAKEPKAYRIKGIKAPENSIKIITGIVSVNSVLDKAHEYGTTVSVLLTAIFLWSINKYAGTSTRKRPIVLTVPVNLRNYFSSASARNFFCTMNVGYLFGENDSLEDVIRSVAESFKAQLTRENLAARMNGFSAIERNIFARITPLPIKDIVMCIAGEIVDSKSTGAISNIGKVVMPDGFEKYVKLFDVFISTEKLQMCLCSYMDNLVLSFSSAFMNTEIQKDFFRTLSSMGIDVQIHANHLTEEEGV